jgi:hypothetical protein
MDLYIFEPVLNKLRPLKRDSSMSEDEFTEFCLELEPDLEPEQVVILVRADKRQCRVTFLGDVLSMHPEEMLGYVHRLSKSFKPKAKATTH